MKTNIWPAVQFNFEWYDENPTRSLTKLDILTLEETVPFPGSDTVKVNAFASRVIITTTTPPEDQEKTQKEFEKRLREALIFLNILP